MKQLILAAAAALAYLPGAKVQATGESLYLGVVKQTGDKGFYKLSVSER